MGNPCNRKMKVKLVCQACHQTFEVLPCRAIKRKRTCSRSCSVKLKHIEGKIKPHPAWNKGKPWLKTVKEKFKVAKLKNPSKYWLNKKRPELRKKLSKQYTKWRKQMSDRTEYRAWRRAVIARDGYQCASCGVVEKRLHVHHIIPVKQNSKKMLDVNNGKILCKRCHNKEHSK